MKLETFISPKMLYIHVNFYFSTWLRSKVIQETNFLVKKTPCRNVDITKKTFKLVQLSMHTLAKL